MMKKLLPLLLMLIGTAGGVGAGFALRPAHAPGGADPGTAASDSQPPEDSASASHGTGGHGATGDLSFVKLNNQFVVPVVSRDRVEALVVMSLSIELSDSPSELVYQREPKLRDQILQVLFDHANMGGFEGAFTEARRLDVLRGALLEVAREVIGPGVSTVLITDIARQDT